MTTQAFFTAQAGDTLITKSETKRNLRVMAVNRDDSNSIRSILFQRINKNGTLDVIAFTRNAKELTAMQESGVWKLGR